jgi:hypothetical protein
MSTCSGIRADGGAAKPKLCVTRSGVLAITRTRRRFAAGARGRLSASLYAKYT